jgi:hypothetical protein
VTASTWKAAIAKGAYGSSLVLRRIDMSEKKSEIKVLKAGVVYETLESGAEVVKFHDTLISIKGTITSGKGTKNELGMGVEWFCKLDGVVLEEVLIPFGESIRIEMAKIRDLDNFVEVATKLNGAEVAFDEIGEWTERAKGERLGGGIVADLVAIGVDREKAKEMAKDPEIREKVKQIRREAMRKGLDL